MRPIFIQTSTNDYGNHIDWAFTNIHKNSHIHIVKCGVYESWFSDHKPIRLEIEFH